MAGRIIGPYFFEDENGNAVTVNGERYRSMLRNFLLPIIGDSSNFWFQQYGASAHTARETMELLETIFGDRIISRNGNINWPPRSPDLTAPDFFLWGYLKERVYVNNPETIEQLKINITNEIAALNEETLTSVMEHVLVRANLCEANGGNYLNDIIFRT